LNLFVDTSGWSLAFRRDAPAGTPEVGFIEKAIEVGESIFTTGLILQELLQGFDGPKLRDRVLSSFSSLPSITPAREDHIDAAALRNVCRRKGIQVGTIDALLAQLCIRHRLEMLTTDEDFKRIAKVAPLTLVRL
jgi:hypothetical protein